MPLSANTRIVSHLDNSECCRTLWHYHCTACHHLLVWGYCNCECARHHHTTHCMVTTTTSHRQLCVPCTGDNHSLKVIQQAQIAVIRTTRLRRHVFACFGQVWCYHQQTRALCRTRTILSIAELCGITTAGLAAVFWRGVTAIASVHATITRHTAW